VWSTYFRENRHFDTGNVTRRKQKKAERDNVWTIDQSKHRAKERLSPHNGNFYIWGSSLKLADKFEQFILSQTYHRFSHHWHWYFI
jgi:hypothetical protein